MADDDRQALALLMLVAARALTTVFLVVVLMRSFPLHLFNPAWQMTFCFTLVNQALLPLLALVLVHTSAALTPQDGRRAATRLRWRSLAVAASLGFVLLLPLQGVATWRGLSRGLHQDGARRLQAEQRSGAMPQGFQEAASPGDDPQARAQRQQGPSLTPADRALLLRQLEANARGARNPLLDRSAGSSPNLVWAILTDGTRLAVSSLAFALAFAAGAQRQSSPIPLLSEWSLVFRRVLRPAFLSRGRRVSRDVRSEMDQYFKEIQSRDP